MKKIILFFAIFSFAFSFSQKTNTRDYEDINARLDRLLREREVEKRVLNVNLEGKTFVLIQNKGTLVYKYVVSFLADKNINIIELINDTSAQSKTTKLYSGDFVRNNNYISVRADVLEGQKIGIPLTYNFMIQERDGILFLININNNEKWIDTALVK